MYSTPERIIRVCYKLFCFVKIPKYGEKNNTKTQNRVYPTQNPLLQFFAEVYFTRNLDLVGHSRI